MPYRHEDILDEIEIAKSLNQGAINLSDNHLEKLPTELFELSKLEYIDLSANKFIEFPIELLQFKDLKEIYLYENSIKEILGFPGVFPALRELDLSTNTITKFSLQPNCVPILKTLNLRDNNISKIDIDFLTTSDIQDLNLSENNISKLPEVIWKLNKLEKLDLSDNPISRLNIGNGNISKSLKEINLRFTEFQHLPKEIFRLSNLESLTLSGIPIKKIPLEITLLKKIKKLDLSYCQLTELPEFISELKELEYLDLDGNKFLGKLPKAITELNSLKKVSLMNCDLKEFPKELLSMGSISTIRLHKNSITEIPKEMGLMKSLEYLDISDNPIETIPKEILAMESLETLYYKSRVKNFFSDKDLKKDFLSKLNKSDNVLIGTVKLKEEFVSAFQKYIIGFDKFLKDYKGVAVNIIPKKITQGIEIEMEIFDSNDDIIEIVRLAFNDYFSLINPDNISSPDRRIDELAENNKILRLELSNSVANFKNEIQIEKVRADMYKFQAEKFEKLLEISLQQKVNLTLTNQLQQAQHQVQSNSLSVNISESRNSINELYNFLTEHKLLQKADEKDVTDLIEYFDSKDDEMEVGELKSDNSFKNKLGRFISKTWNSMKTLKDIAKYPKDILDALNTLIKLATAAGVALNPEMIKQLTDFITSVK